MGIRGINFDRLHVEIFLRLKNNHLFIFENFLNKIIQCSFFPCVFVYDFSFNFYFLILRLDRNSYKESVGIVE